MNDAVIGLDAVTMVVSGKCPKQIEQRIEKRNKQGRLYLEVDKTKQNETYNVTIVLPSIIRPSNLKGFSLLDSVKLEYVIDVVKHDLQEILGTNNLEQLIVKKLEINANKSVPSRVNADAITELMARGKVIELDTYIKERMLPIQFKIFYRLSLFGGLRKGELIALTWQDIDFENNTLSITKSAGHVQEGQTIKATKTVNSNRIIPIPKTEIDLLSRWKTEQKNFMLTVGSKWEGYRGKEFDKNNVFIQMNVNYGKTMNVSTPYRKFVDFINYYNQTIEKEENKLPVIPLHGLRHTCATLNIALGTDIKTVQAILGHANIQTTLNTYTHALEEKKREASNALDVLLNKQA